MVATNYLADLTRYHGRLGIGCLLDFFFGKGSEIITLHDIQRTPNCGSASVGLRAVYKTCWLIAK
jgi:hypothetical protein